VYVIRIRGHYGLKKLYVSPPYKEIFQQFSEYFLSEAEAINDETLNQELEILEMLSVFEG